MQLPVQDDPGTDPGADRDHDQVADALAGSEPVFPQDCQVDIVLQDDRQSGDAFQPLAEREVVPGQPGSQLDRPGRGCPGCPGPRWRSPGFAPGACWPGRGSASGTGQLAEVLLPAAADGRIVEVLQDPPSQVDEAPLMWLPPRSIPMTVFSPAFSSSSSRPRPRCCCFCPVERTSPLPISSSTMRAMVGRLILRCWAISVREAVLPSRRYSRTAERLMLRISAWSIVLAWTVFGEFMGRSSPGWGGERRARSPGSI